MEAKKRTIKEFDVRYYVKDQSVLEDIYDKQSVTIDFDVLSDYVEERRDDFEEWLWKNWDKYTK